MLEPQDPTLSVPRLSGGCSGRTKYVHAALANPASPLLLGFQLSDQLGSAGAVLLDCATQDVRRGVGVDALGKLGRGMAKQVLHLGQTRATVEP